MMPPASISGRSIRADIDAVFAVTAAVEVFASRVLDSPW